MKYLLDINALMGLGFSGHQFHSRVEKWVDSLDRAEFATCAIIELGFVRILSQIPDYEITVKSAEEMLMKLKDTPRAEFTFLNDNLGADQLPAWVKHPKQTTDGHLVVLAKSQGAVLATLDEKIPGSFLIPA